MTYSTPQTPDAVHIIRNDYVALLTTSVPPLLWLLFIVIYIFPDAINGHPVHLPESLLLILVVITLLFSVVLVWRVNNLRDLFASGERAAGTITQLKFLGQSGWVKYTYTYQGEAYETKQRVFVTEQSRRLSSGAAVRVVIDPDDPRRSFIEQLYL